MERRVPVNGALGAAPVDSGPSWGIHRVSDLLTLREESRALPGVPTLAPAARLAAPVAPSRFEVVGLQMEQAEAAVGSLLAFRVWYRARAGAERTRDPDWQRLHLRFGGPVLAIPARACRVDPVLGSVTILPREAAH
jgi:hypothetical protein